ncbi:MAG: hypothetical protein ACYDH1_16025 [Anaerolineaceae bacterium]
MPEIDPIVILRSIRGVPLTCLIALLCAEKPVGLGWLMRATSYSDKPITRALNLLQQMNFVTHKGGYNPWQINPQSLQNLLENLPSLTENCRKISVNLPPATAALNNQEIKEIKAAVVESLTPSKVRQISDSHKLLGFFGVGEPIATVLASQEHMTPRYVAGHILKAKAEKISTALLIHRLKFADPAPDLNTRYHLLGCTCLGCDHLRFAADRGLLLEEDFDVQAFFRQ